MPLLRRIESGRGRSAPVQANTSTEGREAGSCSRCGWPAALTGPTWPRDQRDDVPFPPTTAPFAPHSKGSSGPPRRHRTHNNLSCLVSPTPAARRLSLPRGPPAGCLLDRIVHIEYTVFVQRAEPERSRHLARLDLHFHVPRLGLRRRRSLSKHRQSVAQFLA